MTSTCINENQVQQYNGMQKMKWLQRSTALACLLGAMLNEASRRRSKMANRGIVTIKQAMANMQNRDNMANSRLRSILSGALLAAALGLFRRSVRLVHALSGPTCGRALAAPSTIERTMATNDTHGDGKFHVGDVVSNAKGDLATVTGIGSSWLQVKLTDNSPDLYDLDTCSLVQCGTKLSHFGEVGKVIGFDEDGDVKVEKEDGSLATWYLSKCCKEFDHIERNGHDQQVPDVSVGDAVSNINGTLAIVTAFDKDGDIHVKLSDGSSAIFYAERCSVLKLGSSVTHACGQKGRVMGFDADGDLQVKKEDGHEASWFKDKCAKDLDVGDPVCYIDGQRGTVLSFDEDGDVEVERSDGSIGIWFRNKCGLGAGAKPKEEFAADSMGA